MKLVRENLYEFHKTGDPMKSLGVGIDGLLAQEDKMHNWHWSPENYTGFKYKYFNPKIYDIVNYYGNYIKIFEFTINGIKQYLAISDDIGYDESMTMYLSDKPEDALNGEINFCIDWYGKDLKLSEITKSVSGRMEVPRRTTFLKTS